MSDKIAIERLTADLLSCRGTVKTELAHYERLALVHGKTVLAANYEAEAQRLSDLLDRIDALTATPTAGREDSNSIESGGIRPTTTTKG